MKYVILIHSNATTQQAFADMTEQQQLDFGIAHTQLDQQLAETGELVHSEGLVPGDQSTWVSIRDGEIMATDGPYAEAKEYVAGFYVIDVTDLHRATTIAAQLPEAGYSQVEVRPVFDLSTLDHL